MLDGRLCGCKALPFAVVRRVVASGGPGAAAPGRRPCRNAACTRRPLRQRASDSAALARSAEVGAARDGLAGVGGEEHGDGGKRGEGTVHEWLPEAVHSLE